LAGNLKITAEEERLLEESALLHHLPLELLETETVNRLLCELWPADRKSFPPGERGASLVLPIEVKELLHAMVSPDKSQRTDRISALANILEIANLFDEQLEMAQFEGRSVLQVLETDDPIMGTALQSLRKASRADLFALIPKLPVYPTAAMKALSILANEEVDMRALEQVGTLDPVLAGQVLQAANSAYFGPRFAIKTLRAAISFIGLEATRQILLTAAMKPIFAAPKQKKLWIHSIETAQVAEKIAEMSAVVSPREAFVAGLVHDIGRLAISLLPHDVSSACESLTAKGCEATIAELVLLGFDHSEAGAEVLKIWKFAPEMVDAVRHHHTPDRSKSDLAAVLYLSEFWSAADEDLPSNSVLQSALKQVGLSPEKLGTADLSRVGAVQLLI
jgi:putative nucleotidyltransferase with HDIG domain